MDSLLQSLSTMLIGNGLVIAFATTGAVIAVSYWVADRLLRGRLQGAPIAILMGLLLAWIGGMITGGRKGMADLEFFPGMGILGGAMLRDFAIVATAFGVQPREIRQAGIAGIVALLLGVFVAFASGAAMAYAFGYRDAVSMTTIGAGAATYIVGPVTGTAIGASSDVIVISIAAGVLKAIMVMTLTPMLSGVLGLNKPRSAMIFGGLMETTSGVAGGLAATNPALVPYGAMTATFYTRLGCLLGPSIIFVSIRALFG